MTEPLLEVTDLTVLFSAGRHRPPVRAVDGVSFTIGGRETLGLVGESGSGKTTIGRAILGLIPITTGTITLNGQPITGLPDKQRRAISSELQAIFQDPYGSLNPALAIRESLAEVLRAQGQRTDTIINKRIAHLLQRVGLPADAAERYPAHFSGGQRQRIAIARSLMASPRLVICDEPTSALDLSVQAQVLNLLAELQDEFEVSYLFIGHDLAVIRHVSHRIVVLYRGRVMEYGDSNEIYESPLHPYTSALLAAAPVADPDAQQRRRAARPARATTQPWNGTPNSCPYAPRCPHATEICLTSRPALEQATDRTKVACHNWRDIHSSEAICEPSASA